MTKPYYTLFLEKKEKEKNSERPDLISVQKQIASKIENYRKIHFEKEAFSELRYSYFEKLIEGLQPYGTVYLVRLPVSTKMIELEKEFAPDFEERLKKTAEKYNLDLIDFYPDADRFLCPDGNHLHWEDAKTVSSLLGRFIEKKRIEKTY